MLFARVWDFFSVEMCSSLGCGAVSSGDCLVARVLRRLGRVWAGERGCAARGGVKPPLTHPGEGATHIHPSARVEFRVPAQR